MANEEKKGSVAALRDAMEDLLRSDIPEGESLTDDEILEIERLYKLSSPIRIPTEKLDETYEYRWINKDPKVYRRRRGIGWKPVTKEMLRNGMAKTPIDELHMGTHFDVDGTLCIGTDLVLACLPRRVGDALRQARMRRNQEAMQAGKRRFHQAGELTGVETFDKYPGA